MSDREKYYQLEEEKLTNLPKKIEEEIANYQGIYNSQNNELIKNKESSDQISQEIKIVEDNLSKIENKRENQRNEITRLEGY